MKDLNEREQALQEAFEAVSALENNWGKKQRLGWTLAKGDCMIAIEKLMGYMQENDTNNNGSDNV